MKRILIFILCASSVSTIIAAKKEYYKNDDNLLYKATIEQSQKVPLRQIILAYIMNILHHGTQIAVDPHNRPNLGANITGILGNIVNIALVTTEHKSSQPNQK